MKNCATLLSATIFLLMNCAASANHPDAASNNTQPNLTLQKILPAPTPNAYCDTSLDSDILYGIGYELFTKDKYPEAKSCLIMAAPHHDRAFCYLAIIAQYDEESSEIKRNTEAFNYIAYSASRNDWCAEYKMYESYKYGASGTKQDKMLALHWLKRSAKHGYPDAQQLLKTYYYKQGDIPLSYAWSRIIDEHIDITDKNTIKNMTQKQISESDKHYKYLKKIVTSKQAMKDEALTETIAFLSAGIHLDYPETFKDASASERYEYIKKTAEVVTQKSKLKSKSEIFSYIVVEKHAQKTQYGADISENADIMRILENKKLTTTQKIDNSLAIVNNIDM